MPRTTEIQRTARVTENGAHFIYNKIKEVFLACAHSTTTTYPVSIHENFVFMADNNIKTHKSKDNIIADIVVLSPTFNRYCLRVVTLLTFVEGGGDHWVTTFA